MNAGTTLGIRVGIHTGPLMSGVLGMHRMKFTLVCVCVCVWVAYDEAHTGVCVLGMHRMKLLLVRMCVCVLGMHMMKLILVCVCVYVCPWDIADGDCLRRV